MKKTLLMVLLLMFGVAIQTQAASTSSSQGANSGQAGTSVQGNQNGNTVQTNEQNKVMNQGEATQVQTQEESATKTKDKAKDKKVQDTAEKHRSAVATFVQSLLAMADREGGIGQEVRAIANQQNELKDRAADIIYAVESRNKIKTFLIGTSYKNLGELRSQMVQTQSQIEQLKKMMTQVSNEGDKTELQNQIQVLEQEQASINSFIAENESKFSLLGWAVKLFRK